MWDNVTDIKFFIFGRVYLKNTGSKLSTYQMKLFYLPDSFSLQK